MGGAAEAWVDFLDSSRGQAEGQEVWAAQKQEVYCRKGFEGQFS